MASDVRISASISVHDRQEAVILRGEVLSSGHFTGKCFVDEIANELKKDPTNSNGDVERRPRHIHRGWKYLSDSECGTC